MDLRITYHVHGADERAAAARAREIALEQTVELAADALSADVVARIVGRVEAVKPLGVSATQLAERAYRFSLAGIDLVKDDHSLSDQPPAPFRERVQRCQDAVERANRETGGNTLYLPNVTSGVAALLERAAFAH